MHLILNERELLNARKILMSRIAWEYRSSAYLFGSAKGYEEWVYEVVHEGLAVALDADDWAPSRAEGGFIYFIYMKTRPLIKRDLRSANRYLKAKQALVREVPAATEDDSITRLLSLPGLRQALDQLTPDQRRLVSLHYFAHLPLTDVCRVLGRNRNCVDALHFRAREKLRSALGDQNEPKPPEQERPDPPMPGRLRRQG